MIKIMNPKDLFDYYKEDIFSLVSHQVFTFNQPDEPN